MCSSSEAPRRSVAGVVVRNGLVFVGRRKGGGCLDGKWEFPGGKREEGESDEQALSREYDEEFGLSIRVGRLLGESSFQYAGREYSLAALSASFDGDPPALREHSEVRWTDSAGLLTLDLADSDRTLLGFVLPLLDAGGR
ncbi:MAG TPA: NUDIX domain-containing protein [Spirochaetales bacterium]|nr:NUDIX domain-containing protein [Spirochaetales bacterium]HPE37387.1 NUDIX domain-containing protein [Spirochaetales bacterium]